VTYSDVETPNFDELDINTQALLCKAADLGSKTEFQVPGILPNVRQQLAAGMAAIRIAQALEKLWQPQAAKKIGWRDIFHVAVSWQRVVDPSLPMFWFDKLRRSAKGEHFNEVYIHRCVVCVCVYVSVHSCKRSGTYNMIWTCASHGKVVYLSIVVSYCKFDICTCTCMLIIIQSSGLPAISCYYCLYFYYVT
jgi:hypothetical protein